MTRTLQFISIFFLAYGLNAQTIDVRLVNSNVGSPDYNGWMPGSSSNDTGLNAILAAHNVTSYGIKAGHPYQPFTDRIMEAVCACNPANFVADLEAYSSVVEDARVSTYSFFSDALVTKLVTNGIGVPIAEEGNPVVTNDDGLNQIFSDFNVYYYAQYVPATSNPELAKYYNVVCDCDALALKAALENYPTVIESNSTYQVAAVYLQTSNPQRIKTTVYPNPFVNNLEIQTEGEISRYTMYDVSGKLLANSTSQPDFKVSVYELPAGMYIMKLEFADGTTDNYKLLKK